MKTFTATYNTATMTDVQYSFGANTLGEAIEKAPKLISGEITSVTADDAIDPQEIFEADQILTLDVAENLIGKIISVTNEEYKANTPSVRTARVLSVKSKWELAGEEDFTEIDAKFKTRQEYWKSYMTKKQIEETKNTFILIGDSQLNAGCYINSPEFKEPTFNGSDADRAIYYIVEDEPILEERVIKTTLMEIESKEISKEQFFEEAGDYFCTIEKEEDWVKLSGVGAYFKFDRALKVAQKHNKIIKSKTTSAPNKSNIVYLYNPKLDVFKTIIKHTRKALVEVTEKRYNEVLEEVKGIEWTDRMYKYNDARDKLKELYFDCNPEDIIKVIRYEN